MEQIYSWEATSASQAVSHIFWNMRVHYRIHKSLPPAPLPRQLNPVHALLSYLLKTYFNIKLPFTPMSFKWFLSFGFPHQNFLYIYLLPYTGRMHRPLRLPCPDHPNDIWWEVKVMLLPPIALRAFYSRTPSVSEATHIIGISTTESCRDA